VVGIYDERFAAVIQKKRGNNLKIYKSRPVIVVSGQDSSSLSVISKNLELKSIIISRISPHISASDSENFMYGYLKLSKFTCTKFQQNLFLSVTQDEFRLVNEGGVPSFFIALDLTRYNPRNVTTNLLRPKQCSTLYYC